MEIRLFVGKNPMWSAFLQYRDFLSYGFQKQYEADVALVDEYGAPAHLSSSTSTFRPTNGEQGKIERSGFNPMEIAIGVGGEWRHCWWDWVDFKEVSRVDRSPYGKVELRKDDVEEGVFSTGQWIPPEMFRGNSCYEHSFVFDLYFLGRVTSYDNRVACVKAAKAITNIRTCLGVSSYANRPEIPKECFGSKVSRHRYYDELLSSKLCLAPPGIGEKTWRHMEILALGRPLVMPETDCVWPANYSDCTIVVKRDYSDLAEKVEYFLTHEKEREEIAMRGREYWEKWLSPMATARLFVESVGFEV